MTGRENFWYSDHSEVVAYNLPDEPVSKDAHAEMVIQKFTESSKTKRKMDELKDLAEGSVLVKRENLEHLLALMRMYDAETVKIHFGDNKPLFFEQQTTASQKTYVKGVIAPMLSEEEYKDLKEGEEQ